MKINVKDKLESIIVDIKTRYNLRDLNIEEETDNYWDWLVVGEHEDKSFVMESFIEYCNEDNPNLANEIKVWLADYFDFRNRVIKVEQYEIDWIRDNLSVDTQKIIFGKQIGE